MAGQASSSSSSGAPNTEISDVIGIGFGPASLAVAIAFAETRPDVKATFVDMHDAFAWHPHMLLDGSKMQISFLKDLATMRDPASSYSFLAYLHAHGRLATFINLSTFTPARVEYADYMSWAARRVGEQLPIHYGERVERIEPVRSNAGDVDLVRVHSVRLSDGSATSRLARNVIFSTGGKARVPGFLSKLCTPADAPTAARVLHTSEFLQRVDSVLDAVVRPRGRTLERKRPFSLPPSPPDSEAGSRASPVQSPPSGDSLTLPQADLASAARDTSDRPGIRIAVIGAGQSAVECFQNVQRRLAERLQREPDAITAGQRPRIDLFIRHGALRPSDDSAFSNEVFDPSSTDLMHAVGHGGDSSLSGRVGLGGASTLRGGKGKQPSEEARRKIMAEAKSTNYAVVNPTNVEALYETMYHQRVIDDLIEGGRAPDSVQHIERDPLLSIMPWREIISSAPSMSRLHGISLRIRHTLHDEVEDLEYDFVVAGTGYDRQAWRPLVEPGLHELFGRGIGEEKPSESLSHASAPAPEHPEQPFTVQRDYRLALPDRTNDDVAFKPRIWLQGVTEATHGISDSLLSVLAVRAGEVVTSFSQHANAARS